MRSAHTRAQTQAEPRVRRGYFECRFGQLHVHNAIPAGGGFDEATALICVHDLGVSARVFREFLPRMGRDRSIYAPDLPGYGESDAPRRPVATAELAAALGDFLDSMRLRQVDVLGHRGAAAIAAELAISRPQQVRRVVLVGVPVQEDPRLKAVPQVTLVMRLGDDSQELGSRARDILPRARLSDLSIHGAEAFNTAPGAIAEVLQDFLRG